MLTKGRLAEKLVEAARMVSQSDNKFEPDQS
jgi:hypothetical protein